jgi:hypothetical protein
MDACFGFKILSEDKEHKIARLGINKVLVSLRVEPPAGQIDHFAIGVENFNKEAVTKELQGMGLTPAENIEYGLLRAGSGRSAGADYGALGDCCSDCRWEFELSMAVWTVGGSLDCRW